MSPSPQFIQDSFGLRRGRTRGINYLCTNSYASNLNVCQKNKRQVAARLCDNIVEVTPWLPLWQSYKNAAWRRAHTVGWMDVTQNLTIFAPNLASEWIAGQFQHVEAKIWPNLAVANFNYFSFLFLLYSLGSKLELREIG
jgi:hypothetical protein